MHTLLQAGPCFSQQLVVIKGGGTSAITQDSLRGSSVKIGKLQQTGLAWPLRTDDTHESRSVNKCHNPDSLGFRKIHVACFCSIDTVFRQHLISQGGSRCHNPDFLGFSNKHWFLRGSCGVRVFPKLCFYQTIGSGGASEVMRRFHCSRFVINSIIIIITTNDDNKYY